MAICSACRKSQIRTLSTPPPAYLIVVSNADELNHFKSGPIEGVSYKVPVPFPGIRVIKAIEQRLEALGWESQTEDFMNPGSPTSYVAGWDKTAVLSRPGDKPSKVWRWISDWKNPSGDVLLYV